MNPHLETVGLAVAYADVGLAWTAIRQAYESGATRNQVLAAIEGGCRLAEVPAPVRAVTEDLAQALAVVIGHPPAE